MNNFKKSLLILLLLIVAIIIIIAIKMNKVTNLFACLSLKLTKNHPKLKIAYYRYENIINKTPNNTFTRRFS